MIGRIGLPEGERLSAIGEDRAVAFRDGRPGFLETVESVGLDLIAGETPL